MLTFEDIAAGSHRVLALTGRLDTNTSGELDRHLAEHVGLADRLVLELTSIEYVSSAGLRVVLMLAKKLQRGGGALVLCGMSAGVREVFDIAGFSKILTIEPDRASALTRLG